MVTKMAKRMSDTEALTVKPYGGKMQKGESVNIDVRPIDNGYVVRKTQYSGDGDYSCSESFSKDRPNIDGAKTSVNRMKMAVDYLKKDH